MLTERSKQFIFIILVIIVAVSFWSGVKYAQWRLMNEPVEVIENKEVLTKPKKVYVHITGEVQKPGVYILEEGARLDDILKMAKTTEKAEVDKFLNRAEVLKDGQKVIVPNKEDVKIPEVQQDITNNANIITTNKININTASKKELENLSGIGPKKAEAIIDYRNKNGGFKSEKEITRVNGIGESTYEKIKDMIIVK